MILYETNLRFNDIEFLKALIFTKFTKKVKHSTFSACEIKHNCLVCLC